MINALDLFSGIGGISLALRDYAKTALYCETNSYCRQILTERMKKNELDKAPVWGDIRTLRGDRLRGYIDIITGGFPCQDISVAGHGKGLAGERSGLFFEILRLAEEIQPAFIFLENVPAIRTRGLSRVGRELAQAGYDCRWCVISAASVGAPHRRERWFLLAHPNQPRLERRDGAGMQECPSQRAAGSGSTLGNSQGERLAQPMFQRQQAGASHVTRASWWEAEPSVGRVADGVSRRVDRIKCLGNSVVPLQVKTAFEYLLFNKRS